MCDTKIFLDSMGEVNCLKHDGPCIVKYVVGEETFYNVIPFSNGKIHSTATIVPIMKTYQELDEIESKSLLDLYEESCLTGKPANSHGILKKIFKQEKKDYITKLENILKQKGLVPVAEVGKLYKDLKHLCKKEKKFYISL